MTNTDLEMFMVKLRRLVYDDSTPIGNNPFIEERKPEIQLLYEELACLIGSCFKDMTIDEEQLEKLEDVRNWKRRLMEAAQEAEGIVDMLVSSAIIKNRHRRTVAFKKKIKKRYRRTIVGRPPVVPTSQCEHQQTTTAPNFKDSLLDCSLKGLMDVMDGLKSIREEMSSKKGNFFQNLVELDMMGKKVEAPGTCSNENTTVNLRTTEHEEVVVGFDDDALLIIDRLTGDRKKLDIISIVGMGGLGKTTLATKIFNDSFIEYHFDIRGWVTVSQGYSKRDMLLQLLASIGKPVHEAATEKKMDEMLYQSLKGRRYLIVFDDIWSCKAWEDVGRSFPDDCIGSRVLVTTRLTEVAWNASRGGFTHNLRQLTEDQSWELLCRKTFRGHECPESLTETGKHIAKKCQGLPLALVVIGGILEKGEKRKDLWQKVAETVGSYAINDPEGCLDTLALSYDHLPRHLKKCFLYVGGFPEDYKIEAQRLIRLWMAEGFIKEAGQRSLEEEGESYLMDLTDRNLLIVADKRSDGGIKSCRLHDLLRELCLKKADEELFFKKTSMSMLNNDLFSNSTSSMEQHRLFADYEVLYKIYSHDFATRTRSVLCFHDSRLLEYRTTISWLPSFLLLRVLDLLNIPMVGLSNVRLLVHLRYLAVWSSNYEFLVSDSEVREFLLSNVNLWRLQTLVVKGKCRWFTYSPNNMVNLRHLRCDSIRVPIDFRVLALSNLQTISRLRLDDMDQHFLQSFPNIKKLGCEIYLRTTDHVLLNFALLTRLEALDIQHKHGSVTLRYPETLKKLTLKGLHAPWKRMSTIQQLPNLEVLKLLDYSFKGHLWETSDEPFHQLKFLKLEKLDIRFWKASSINFPRLRKLVVRGCKDLEEIPLDLGNSYTLEHIEIDNFNSRVRECVNRIQEAQRDTGNNDLHVKFTDHMDSSDAFYRGNPFFD